MKLIKGHATNLDEIVEDVLCLNSRQKIVQGRTAFENKTSSNILVASKQLVSLNGWYFKSRLGLINWEKLKKKRIIVKDYSILLTVVNVNGQEDNMNVYDDVGISMAKKSEQFLLRWMIRYTTCSK